MRNASRLGIACVSCLVLLSGCNSANTAAEAPARSVAELRTMAEHANANADPYALGTGDRIGAQTFGIFLQDHKQNSPSAAVTRTGSRTAAGADR